MNIKQLQLWLLQSVAKFGKTWISCLFPAYNEAFDAYHRTTVGTDGDWESNMKQFLRCGLAFTFTGVVAADIATDALFGQGGRRTSKVNIGAFEKGYVNIAVHGHLPTLVSQICKIGASEEYLEKQKLSELKVFNSMVFAALAYPVCTAMKMLFHCVMLSALSSYLVQAHSIAG